jgi:hypothetical protein
LPIAAPAHPTVLWYVSATGTSGAVLLAFVLGSAQWQSAMENKKRSLAIGNYTAVGLQQA